MTIKFLRQTDTLYIELRPAAVIQTRDLDELTQVDVDENGTLCAITIEQASRRVEIPGVSFEEVAA